MGWTRGKDNQVEDFESSEIVLYYTTTVDPVYIHSNSLNVHYTTLVGSIGNGWDKGSVQAESALAISVPCTQFINFKLLNLRKAF